MEGMSQGMRVAVLIMLITFLYMFSVTFLDMPASGEEQAKTIVPFLLGTVLGTLMGFYYGKKHEMPNQEAPPDDPDRPISTDNE